MIRINTEAKAKGLRRYDVIKNGRVIKSGIGRVEAKQIDKGVRRKRQPKG